MRRFRKLKYLIIIAIIFGLIYYKYIQQTNDVINIPSEFPIGVSSTDASQVIIILREFESFNNDVVETAGALLRACNHHCKVIIASDELNYPPLKIPNDVEYVILQSNIYQRSPDIFSYLTESTFVMIFPDGARLSSFSQLKEYINLLETGDSEILAVGVGGALLTCYQYIFDIRTWTLTINPAHHNEVCDGVSGKAAFIMRTSNFVKFTYPLTKPVAHSLGIQSSARNWKFHIARGAVLGESKRLYESDQFKWKHDTLENERIRELYSKLDIKKVVGSNGKVEWYGCNKKSPRCFPTVVYDTPAYLYQGHWTPPCCLENLRATARHVFQVLRDCHVRWWLEGGSLLGAVRNGDIIPWDYDVDIGVYANDVDRCPQLKSSRWQTLEDAEGFIWQKATEGKFYRVYYSTANHLHIDIYPFQPVDGEMKKGAWTSNHRQDVDFPEHFLRPLSSISFIGVVAASPNNVREFLELKFGIGVVENPQYSNIDILNYYNASHPSIH